MKAKRMKLGIIICSAILLIGLGLLSFEPSGNKNDIHVTNPSGSPSNPSEQEPTQAPTGTPTPTPSPTPSLVEKNASLPLISLSEDTYPELYRAAASYLDSLYQKGTDGIKGISNIHFYCKDGISYDSVIYAEYEITYEDSLIPVPTLSVFFAGHSENGYTLTSESVHPEDTEALFLSRGRGEVFKLYVKHTIRRYMNAKLACDESMLAELVTDPAAIDIETLRTKTEYIEEYRNLEFLIRNCYDPAITEFDCIVYVANDVKFINIKTPAAGLDEYVIQLDENNYPKIFYGVTSEAADAFRITSRQQNDYQTMLEDVVARYAEAILKDSDLRNLTDRIYNTTE